MGKMAEIGQRERTVLFVSHDMGAITRLCARAVWLEAGHIRADGRAQEIVSSYLDRAKPGQLLEAEFVAEPGAAAAVRRVTVRDAATGQLLAVPERGRPFTIEMVFEARELIPDLVIALMLINEQGVIVIDDAVRDSPTADALSAGPGVYVASATIPPLLPAGTYLVRAWIGNDFESHVDHELLTFRVAPRPNDPQELIDRRRAVQPEIDWRIRREPLP
jgi:ABC-2 type transport system ATP-binding protein/lipopolysaccharide transport system ATP-binding protein